jgi:hypothetical protein
MRDVLYCPGCQRRLQLPDEAYGKAVQCPSCQRVFTAEPNLTNPPASAGAAKMAGLPAANKPAPARAYDEVGDLDRPRNRRRGRDDDDSPPRPRRPVAHRGGEILTFGLLALIPCPLTGIIFGIIAWMMGNADLKEMRSGRMDREGEGLTQWGRVLGMIGVAMSPICCGCIGMSNFRF